MMRTTGLMALLLVMGCGSPSPTNAECGPDDQCPQGQVCGADHVCHEPGVVDARTAPDAADIDGPVLDGPVPDAPAVDAGDAGQGDAMVDAGMVTCASNADCQNPPSCFLPGTCDTVTSTCQFPARDCSDLNSECAVFACNPALGDNGECELSEALNEGSLCGEGEDCTPLGACEPDDSGECTETGTQMVSCARETCQAGICTDAPDVTRTQSCAINSDGKLCGGPETCTPTGACETTTECGESGVQDTSCVKTICQAGACVDGPPRAGVQTCTIDTDGNACTAPPDVGKDDGDPNVSCGALSECVPLCKGLGCVPTPDDICATDGRALQTCDHYSCASGSCSIDSSEDQQVRCTRDTDGVLCDTCPINQQKFCSKGTCPDCDF